MRSITARKNKALALIVAVLLIFGVITAASGRMGITALAAGWSGYTHDPRLNPSAMKDIVEDESAVYGFRPSETGSLKQYAGMDWTDPEAVEQGRQERIAYHESLGSLYEMLYEMTSEGKSTEEIACAVSTRRNELRMEFYENDPEGLETLKERNLEKYGHEEGPLPEELFEKYGSWETVIDKAFSPNAGMDACLGLYDDYYETYVLLGMIEDDSLLPHKVDLRDFGGKNYVTPVKFQNPFGSCWAFALAGAAEECYLFDNDMGVPAGEKNEGINISEKFIVWNVFHNLSEPDAEGNRYIASQVGEGYNVEKPEEKNINAVYDFGGFADRAANLLMSGFGLMDEDCEINGDSPFVYRGKEGLRNNDRDLSKELAAKKREYYYNVYKTDTAGLIRKGEISSEDEYDEWFDENWAPGKTIYERSFKYGCYSPVDDWTIPEGAEYLTPAAESMLRYIKYLTDPAQYDENGDYVFDPDGLECIKGELANGHAVSIALYADRSKPDDDDLTEDCIINFDHWAQYDSADDEANHVVTIVGYDDSYPKENFTRTFDGHVVEGSTPPADGAFIVKNSWGSVEHDPEDPNYSDWGYEGSGYFFLSYYDHSLDDAVTFEFYTKDEVPCTALYYDQYDLLFGCQYSGFMYVDKVKMANIFYADDDSFIGWISTFVFLQDTTIHYEIYKDPEEGAPDSGILLESGEQTFEYTGYGGIQLKNKYFLKEGERYSVVILQSAPYYDEQGGEMTVYPVSFPHNDVLSADGRRIRTVVNEGESFLGVYDRWDDFSVITPGISQQLYEGIFYYMTEEEAAETYVNGAEDFVVDNLPIKAMLIPASEYTCPHTEHEYVSPVASTETSEGSRGYYICRLCGKWFEDAEGTKEITDHDSVILPALSVTTADKPTDDPAEKPTDDPTDKPTDDPTYKPTDDPTDKPTDDPTDKPTDDPTDKPTDDPTDKPIDKPTDKPTDAPADKPTDAPTDKPTDDPTDKPTDDPTDKPTDKPTDDPTDKPTDDPTDKPTDDPTDKPSESTSGEIEVSYDYPATGGTFPCVIVVVLISSLFTAVILRRRPDGK